MAMIDFEQVWRGVSRWSRAAAATFLFASIPARAEEPKGCAAFKWPLDREATLLRTAANPVMADDGPAKSNGMPYDLKLVPLAEARLPQPPERKPKSDPSSEGFLLFEAPARPGAYQIAISQAAWIDVIQDGHYIKPTAFSGATDCPGVRKSIRFDLGPRPFLVQISGTTAPSVALLFEPVRP